MTPHTRAPSRTVERLKPPPLLKTLAIAISNARRRAMRSILTIASIAMGVAFLSYVAGSSLIDNARQKRTGLTQAVAADQQPAQAAKQYAETVWIIAVSLLVCTVGIANAMLMSVTERYQEIGTIKCLGALDGFVLQLFLLEAGGQGLIGGLVGAIAGTLLALAEAGLGGGDPVLWTIIPYATWLTYLVGCIGVGVVLAVVAAVYPAWVAMRMAPIDALRARF